MDAQLPQLVILTGMSGAGKSTALRCFEDLGYFCIDNLPPTLIGIFLKLYQQSPHSQTGVAIVSDIRSGELFEHFAEAIEQLNVEGTAFEIVFIDCADEELVHRFHATRRRPPLGAHLGLAEALAAERLRLRPVGELATTLIDTSHLTPAQLRERVLGLFSQRQEGSLLAVTLLSFGYKYGIPADADFVFDGRFLPNPYYVDELRDLTGSDQQVRDYVMGDPQAQPFIAHAAGVLGIAFERYPQVHKYTALVAIGCTGGRHRSVCLINSLAAVLLDSGIHVNVQHRDITMPQ